MLSCAYYISLRIFFILVCRPTSQDSCRLCITLHVCLNRWIRPFGKSLNRTIMTVLLWAETFCASLHRLKFIKFHPERLYKENEIITGSKWCTAENSTMDQMLLENRNDSLMWRVQNPMICSSLVLYERLNGLGLSSSNWQYFDPFLSCYILTSENDVSVNLVVYLSDEF